MTIGANLGGFPLGLDGGGTPAPIPPDFGPFVVDWDNLILHSTSSLTNVVELQAWLRNIESSQTGVLYPTIHTYKKVGIGGGAFSHFIDFINGWTLQFPNGNWQVIGNVTVTINPVPGAFVEVLKATSFASLGGTQAEELEQLAFEGVILVDQINGLDLSDAGRGTRKKPCKTLAFAIGIGDPKGIYTLRVRGFYVLAFGEVVTSRTLVGKNLNNDRISSPSGSALIGCDFENLWVTGPSVIGGTYQECFVEDVATMLGGAKDSGFLGTFGFYPAAPNACQLFDCHVTRSSNASVTLNADPVVNILLHRCSGHWILRNVTAGTHVLNMAGGQIELDATCTGGTVVVRGDVSLTDNSLGTTVVDGGITIGVGSLTSEQNTNLAKVNDVLALSRLIPGLV